MDQREDLALLVRIKAIESQAANAVAPLCLERIGIEVGIGIEEGGANDLLEFVWMAHESHECYRSILAGPWVGASP